MDTIEAARVAMESADDAFMRAEAAGASAGVLDELVQAVADAEQAYYRACDVWAPVLARMGPGL